MEEPRERRRGPGRVGPVSLGLLARGAEAFAPCTPLGAIELLKANGKVKADLTMDMPAQLVSQGAPQSLTMNMNMNMSIARV